MRTRQTIAAAAAAAALAGGAAMSVPAFAAGGSTSPTAIPGQTQTTSTDRSGTDARTGTQTDPHAASLAELVKAGTITQAQADAVTKKLQADRPAPEGRHGGPGGHGGPMGGPGRDGGQGRGHQVFAAAATTLHLSEDQLRTELAGKTLAQVAKEKSVSRDTLAAALKKAMTADIDTRVTELLDHQGPGPRGPQGGPGEQGGQQQAQQQGGQQQGAPQGGPQGPAQGGPQDSPQQDGQRQGSGQDAPSPSSTRAA